MSSGLALALALAIAGIVGSAIWLSGRRSLRRYRAAIVAAAARRGGRVVEAATAETLPTVEVRLPQVSIRATGRDFVAEGSNEISIVATLTDPVPSFQITPRGAVLERGPRLGDDDFDREFNTESDEAGRAWLRAVLTPEVRRLARMVFDPRSLRESFLPVKQGCLVGSERTITFRSRGGFARPESFEAVFDLLAAIVEGARRSG